MRLDLVKPHRTERVNESKGNISPSMLTLPEYEHIRLVIMCGKRISEVVVREFLIILQKGWHHCNFLSRVECWEDSRRQLMQ